jgi:hypothetical protein
MARLETAYQRGAVKPLECYKEGWALIRRGYWVYFGITVMGVLIASWVPFGILMGPMFCGIYFCILQGLAAEPVEFSGLFRGFDYVVQSMIATLFIMIAGLIVAIPFTFLIVIRVFLLIGKLGGIGHSSQDMLPSLFGHLAVEIALLVVLMLLCIIPLSALTTFTYPLIVDRHLTAIEALTASVRAGLGNFLPLVGLFMLNMVLGLAGAALCYVGAFFVLPLSMAATAVAYRQAFPKDGA